MKQFFDKFKQRTDSGLVSRVSSGVSGITASRQFSKRDLLIFATIFVAIGIVIIFRSFAAANLYVAVGGSGTSCTQAEPCGSFAAAYQAAVAGDIVQIAPGTYPRQDIPADTKAVTFKGQTGVVVRQLYANAANLTFDGIDLDAGGIKTTGAVYEPNAPNITFKNGRIGNVVDEKGSFAGADCVGCVYDNVQFHNVRIATDGVHNECLYSQAADITVTNSRFTNCATMDIFFTRGTWWNQPTYGGFTLTNNFFGKTYKLDGTPHYFTVVWANNNPIDRAVVRNNTFELPVSAEASFTNSVESCNTPSSYLNLPGMTHETCGTQPTTSPTVNLTASPASITAGASSTLSWSSTNASSCTASGAWSGSKATGGSQSTGVLSAEGTNTYTLTCAGSDGSANASAVITVSAAPTPPSQTPVAAYHFDEGTGTTAADVSGNNNSLNIPSTAWTTSGKNGKAASFNGSAGSFAQRADSNSLDIGGGGTIEAWFKPNVLGVWHGVIAKGSANDPKAHNYSLEIDNTNKPVCSIGNGSVSTEATGSMALSAGSFYHLACVWDGANLKLYINGAQNASAAQTLTPAGNSAALYVGQYGGNVDQANGIIDDVRIYNKALSASEIVGDMNTSVGGAATPPAELTVSINTPMTGCNAATPPVCSGTVTATATTSSATKVDFYIDNAFKTSDTAEPFNYSFGSAVLGNGSHTLKAVAHDSGGATKEAVITFTVNNTDTTPPSVPSNLSATATSSTSINLAWTASTDNVGVTKYNVLRKGPNDASFIVIAQPATNSYTNTGLTANTQYQYYIQAVDSAGNTSGNSNTIIYPDTSSAEKANLWIDISGGSCIRQATPGSYSDGGACGSFDAAWDAANAGDTIVVKAGTYTRQVVTGDKTSETKIIGENGTIIKGALADCRPEFGAASVFCAGADFLTLENVSLDSGTGANQAASTRIFPDISNVTFRNVNMLGDFPALYIEGSNFKWEGGVSGNPTPGVRTCSSSYGYPVIFAGGSNITIDGVRFNPMKLRVGAGPYCGSDNTPHLETMRINGGSNLTIKNNYFVGGSDAGSGHIFSSVATTGVKLVNNYWGAVNGSYWVQAANSGNSSWTLLYNTFTQGASLEASAQTWVGNLGHNQGCTGTHVKNLWQGTPNGIACNGADKTHDNLGIGPDGRLLGESVAIDAAEAPSTSDYCTRFDVGSTDSKATPRPQGTACDAGADEFGSGSTSPSETTVTAPTLAANAVSTSQINLSWNAVTDPSGIAGYNIYRGTSSTNITTKLNSNLITGTSFGDTGLAAGTTYYYQVEAVDGAGNKAKSSIVSTSTQSATPPADTIPPTISITSPTNGAVVNGTITASADASDNALVGGVQFKVDGVNRGSEDTVSPYNLSLDTLTLSNGTHTITAVARDTTGNTAVASISVNVNNVDTQTPNAPSSLCGITTQPTSASQGKIDLTWPTATDNGSPASGIKSYLVQRRLSTDSSYITIATVTSFASKSCNNTTYAFSYTDSNVPIGTVSYVIRAVDNVNLTSTASSPVYNSQIFSVVTAQDTTPPTAPLSLAAQSIGQKQINLAWGASVDRAIDANNKPIPASGVKEYRIYRDNKLTYTLLATGCINGLCTHGDTGLKPDTTYAYYIKAVDNAGNISDQSNIAHNTTLKTKKGDVNGDNVINIFDLSILSANWGSTNATPEQGDLNGDGKVDIFDLSIIASQWGS